MPLTYTEAGAYIGVSRWTIAEMIERGELPFILIGRTRKVRPVDLDRYLDRSTVAS